MVTEYAQYQHRLQKYLVNRARDIYSRARIYRLPSERITELIIGEIFNSSKYSQASGYVQSYVRGCLDILYNEHYEVLRFGYVQEDGVPWTTDELRAEYPDTWMHYCNSDNGSFFYADDPDRPLF